MPKTKLLFSLLFLSTLIFQLSFFVPSSHTLQAASLVPCGASVDDKTTPINEMAPCTLCHLLFGIQNIITWMRNVMTAIAIAVIVGMGILYIVSAGNDSLMGYAKTGITAALIGFAVILCAWLIVSAIFNLKIFNTTAGLVRSNWNTFSCNLTSTALSGTGPASNPGVISTTPGSPPPNPIPPVPPTSINPSTGVALTLANGQVYPGTTTTLTVSGNINKNLGPISFNASTASISIPSIDPTITLQTTVTILSNATPGTYTIDAYQQGTFLASISITVIPLPLGGGGDTPPPPPPPPPGGGPPFSGTCPGFAGTFVSTMNWAAPMRIFTGTSFGSNDAWVIQFTTPTNTNTTSVSHFSGAEWTSNLSWRDWVLADHACEFNPANGVQPPTGSGSGSTTVSSFFYVGTPGSCPSCYAPVLVPNTTYYLNVRNFQPNPSCAGSSCSMFMDLIKGF